MKPDARLIADDILTALALLSRLPLPDHRGRGIAAAWAWPLAGLVLAVPAGLAGALALALGLPPGAAALVVIAVQAVCTGALHEDGLADTADGLWGGWTRDRRLEIMRDSRIGSYGVIALVLGLGARWTALAGLMAAGLPWGALVAAAVLSRGVLPAVMAALPPARPDGLSRATGRPSVARAGVAAGLAAGLALLALGPGVVAAFLVAFLVALALASVARVKLGGQTGDILGAIQQLTEIGVLFTVLAAQS